MELRHYQEKAVEALFSGEPEDHPLIVMPTGTGKSLVISDFCRRAIKHWPDTRILIACHVKELVQQNYEEFMGLWWNAPAGVYSAGLRRREAHSQVLFCGIQSVYEKAFKIQKCDVLLVDEAHSIPHKGQGMWRKFIADLGTINPSMRVAGLTATDYRLDSGSLTKGDDRIFTHVAYKYPILEALAEGYLSPVVPKHMATGFDVSGVHKRGGEFIAGELERAVNVEGKTKLAIDEVEQYGANRKSWLIFAAGNAHANAIHEELKARGYIGECVTQETPRPIRDKAVKDIKSGAIRYIVNNKIFTVGFNAPNVDLIADLGPTQSAGLHVQKIGRGMRNFPGKENCLLLDFARNTDRHGPIDLIEARDKQKGEGDAPMKICTECHCVCFAGVRYCPDCGHEFPANPVPIQTTASKAPVVSTQIQPEKIDVTGMTTMLHDKPGKIPSMKVSYYTMSGIINEWICFQHSGFAREKAVSWHRKRLPNERVPKNIAEALELQYPVPSKITVRQNGKFFDILGHEFGEVKKMPPIEMPIMEEEWEIKW